MMTTEAREARAKARKMGHTLAPGKQWAGDEDASPEYLTWCVRCSSTVTVYGGCSCHGVSVGGRAIFFGCDPIVRL